MVPFCVNGKLFAQVSWVYFFGVILFIFIYKGLLCQ